MSLGTRFRSASEATSFKTTLGTALVGVAMLGGTLGSVSAQEASPAACPPASPVAVASPAAAPGWITDVAIDPELEATGDSTTVGVKIGEILEINVAEFETRPFVLLQATNNTEAPVTTVVFSTPEGFDATCFTLPADAAELPEGVTPLGSFSLDAGAALTAVFPDLAPGAYLIVTDSGLTLPFTVLEATTVEVPDLFGTPESTPAS
jgi:hypothetical protein